MLFLLPSYCRILIHIYFHIYIYEEIVDLVNPTRCEKIGGKIDKSKCCILHVFICNHHHHHIVLAARISLTLSRHSSLSFIALGRSSGQQPVSSHSC